MRWASAGLPLDRRYEVDEFVAEGGFGVVYRGRLLPWKEPVAIKVCKLDPAEDETLRPESHSHFLTEAAIVAKLTHPAIVRVRDFGVSPMPDGQDAPWLVFDWVSGRTLADDLDERWNDPPRAPWEVLELMRPVLRALAMAHAQGIAHRDIKPANLMLMARAGGNDEVPVRVLDSGCRRCSNSTSAASRPG
ncbi:MAG: serine/threonine protein kinase [Deltaproteobacteria bacterium]|nr:serine/threonine protein kinase [Deltaproteobacteria bacterium]